MKEKYLDLLIEMMRQQKTQKDMADVIGKSEGTFSNKVNGISDFHIHEASKIIKALKLTPDQAYSIFFAKWV